MEYYDRLCQLSSDQNWDEFVKNLDAKTDDERVIAKLAELLTEPDGNLPLNVLFQMLKCLANSCAHFEHESPEKVLDKSDDLLQNHCYELYRELAKSTINNNEESSKTFPYNGIAQWVIDYLREHGSDDDEEQIKILRTCLRFLCNVSTTTDQGCRAFSSYGNLQATVGKVLQSKDTNVLLLTCAVIHNILFNLEPCEKPLIDYQSTVEGLIRADSMRVSTANDTIMLLLRRTPDLLDRVYEQLSIENKLYLLEVIYQNLKDVLYNEHNEIEALSETTIIYLMNRFKRRSDLILKTVDTYLNDMEPAEVVILLDILGVLSAGDRKECEIVQRDSSLLINAVFLLRALHMAGRESENYFTPVQKLSDIAPTLKGQGTMSSKGEDIRAHPAFGFKAALIRLLGNLVYKHRANQNTLRDTDGIGLILDCCNIDGRNPLILQWCILAIRNLCDGAPHNQQYVAKMSQIKYIDTGVLREMGITLNQDNDGNAIGMVPLPGDSHY